MIHAFLRTPGAGVGIAFLLVLLVTVIIGPELASGAADTLNFGRVQQPPSSEHLLGTDALGRDILARLIVASRLSIILAFYATIVGAGVGMVWGAGMALLPRGPRWVSLRILDALLSFPGLLVAIVIAAIVGPGILSATVGVMLGLAFSYARVTSNLALSLVSREFIQAARILGVKGPRLVVRHILPNAAETLVVTTTVGMGRAVAVQATLSFLGLGVQPPLYDWGALLTDGVQKIYVAPAAAAGPAVAIALVSLSLGFLGESLARALNPALWGSRRMARSSDVVNQASDLSLRVLRSADQLLATGTPTWAPGSANGHSPDHVLEVKDLTVSFPGATAPMRIVDGVTFSVSRGEMIGIAGESGSGKTMTAMAIAGLVPHPGSVSGVVRLTGRDLLSASARERREAIASQMAIVFQDPMTSFNPMLSIGSQMTEAVEVHNGLRHREALAMAAERLKDLNVPAPSYQLPRYPHELSGGMRQRVMIGMGLMHAPVLLIADEPTTALDLTVQAQLMEVFGTLNNERGMAVLLISHNLGLLSQNCSRVMTMYAGRIVEDGRSDEVLLEPLHPYTRALIAAIPKTARPRTDRLESIQGLPPDFNSLPEGCAYQPRCPFAVERCRTEIPPLATRPDGRRVACWVANAELNACSN